MNRLSLLPLAGLSVAAALASSYLAVACGGNDDKSPSNGGSSAGTTAAPSGGTGGTGTAVGGTTGGSVVGGTSSVTPAECMTKHFSDPAISTDCKQCMCQCNADLASRCDENCWKLARCVQVSCANNTTDLSCLSSMCGTFLAGAVAAAPLTKCLTQCGPTECASWFAAGETGGTGGGGGSNGGGGSGGSAGETMTLGGTDNQGGAG